MIWIVAVLGTPWTNRQLAEYRVDVTDRSGGWMEATISFLGNLIVQASSWPLWLPDLQRRGGAYQDWLAFGPRTVVFLALLIILLNRLDRYRPGRQDRLIQALTVFGAVLACAAIAGLVTAPFGDQYYYGYYRRGASAQLLTLQFSASVTFGVVWGTVLALFSIRRPADPDRHRRPMDLGGA